MISNLCEDQSYHDKIAEHHEKMLSNFGIPAWSNIKCPFCKKDLPLRSIRSISIKLNTRNIGDIALEIFCTFCSKMDTLYYKSEVANMDDFVNIIKGNNCPKNQPLLEEKMYKLGYNNVVEDMLKNGEAK